MLVRNPTMRLKEDLHSKITFHFPIRFISVQSVNGLDELSTSILVQNGNIDWYNHFIKTTLGPAFNVHNNKGIMVGCFHSVGRLCTMYT